MITNYDHNCNDDNCSICLIRKNFNDNKCILNNDLTLIIFIMFVFLLTSNYSIFIIDKSKYTLVGLKVQINENCFLF